MKRFLSVGLCLALLMSLFICPVTAEDVIYEKGFDYRKINSGTEAEIVTYYGLGGDLVIPETLGGLPVTSVASGAIVCQSDTQITTLSLPSGLTSFSADSILNNLSLEAISLSSGNSAFALLNGVLYTADGKTLVLYPAASAADALVIPEGVERVGSAAFYGAANLAEITLPSTLSVVEANAQPNRPGTFENCTALERLNFPASLTEIGDYAFMGCSALKSVSLPYSSTSLSVGIGAFLNCPLLSSVHLYSNVKSIDMEAFGFVSSLNAEEIMVTSKLDGFCIYAVDGTAGATYAKNNEFDFSKMLIVSDFFTGVAAIGPESAVVGEETEGVLSTVRSVTYSELSSGGAFDLAAANLSGAERVAVYQIDFTARDSQSIPAPFAEKILFSLPFSSALSSDSDVYVFFAAENGSLSYVPSTVCLSPGSWGDPALRLLLETDAYGTFIAVNATCSPGDIDLDGGVSATDLVQFAKSLAAWPSSVSLVNADVNGNGVLGAPDLTHLAKYLASWSVELYAIGSKA